jgi:uncharacterized membrane protein SirB2
MDYLALKSVHVSSVAASYVLFFTRGIWMMRVPHLLTRRWVRIVPHVVDTILLASAIALAVTIRQYPFVADWLTAKVIGLVVYIVLGSIALKRGRSKRVRIGAWLAAQAVFAYIVAVALAHDPAPWRVLG